MSVKGGLYAYEGYEAKKIKNKHFYVFAWYRHRFYTYQYYLETFHNGSAHACTSVKRHVLGRKGVLI